MGRSWGNVLQPANSELPMSTDEGLQEKKESCVMRRIRRESRKTIMNGGSAGRKTLE